MNGACQRVGADGFFCLFRNNSDFFINPEWHFSRKELEDYMPVATRKAWDTGEVGLKLEAFAIAGCDTTSTSCLHIHSCYFLMCSRFVSHSKAEG
jgi:hypothetical protein